MHNQINVQKDHSSSLVKQVKDRKKETRRMDTSFSLRMTVEETRAVLFVCLFFVFWFFFFGAGVLVATIL